MIDIQPNQNLDSPTFRKINVSSTQQPLQDRIQELTQAKEFIELYVSVINHDIYAPIKFINIIGDNLNPKRYTKPELLENFLLIINSTKRLELLCSNLLELLNTNNNVTPSFTKINLYQLIQSIQEFFAVGFIAKEIRFINKIQSDLEIITIENHLSIIITNLISNALRFTQNGEICIESSADHNQTLLIISDTGKGIQSEIKEQLNRKNFKIQHKNAIKYRSYGFGYNLIFKLLSQIQADIHINNNRPQGTSVTLKLPNNL
jgi:signal transduction histidine kinase